MNKNSSLNNMKMGGIILIVILALISTLSAVSTGPKPAAAQAEELSRFHPLTTWSTEFSNENGWNENEKMWSSIRFPDLNSDSRDDICSMAGEKIVCGISDETSFNDIQPWLTDFAGALLTDETVWRTIKYPDVTGDEKADICMRTGKGIYCAISSGTAFGPLTPWETGHFTDAQEWNADPSYWSTIRYPDLNGDGAQDLCGRDAGGIRCSLSTGTTFTDSVYWDTSFSNANGWNSDPSYWGTIQYVDINGDGRDDICGRGGLGILCGLSTGSDFLPVTYWDNSFTDTSGWNNDESYWATIQYPDLNGDGKADICGRGGAGMACGLSDGQSFAPVDFWTFHYGDPSWSSDPSYWKTIRFADINIDGLDDICGRHIDGLVCMLSSGSEFIDYNNWQYGFSNDEGWKENESMWSTLHLIDVNQEGLPAICGRDRVGIVCAPAAVNNKPIAVPDQYSTSMNTALVVSAEDGVIKNDSDIDQEELISFLAESPLHGQLTLNQDGSFTYIPNEGFLGSDIFSYVLLHDEGQLLSNPADVTIQVIEATPTATPTASPTPTGTVTPPPTPNPAGFTLYLPLINR